MDGGCLQRCVCLLCILQSELRDINWEQFFNWFAYDGLGQSSQCKPENGTLAVLYAGKTLSSSCTGTLTL